MGSDYSYNFDDNELNDLFEESDVVEVAKKYSPDLPFISSAELLEMADNEVPYIIETFLPEAGLCALSGAPAAGKTWIMLLMAMAVSKGASFLGRFATAQTNVGVIDEESGEMRLAIRLKKLGVDGTYPIQYLSKFGVKITDRSTHQKIVTYCKAKDIRLLFFDSLVRIHNAKNENDATEMNKVYEALKGFQKAGIAVVFTHHHAKRIGDKGVANMRGSGDIPAWVDTHFSVDKADDIHTIAQPKARDFEEIKPFKVRRSQNADETLTFTYLGEAEGKTNKKEDTKNSIIELLSESEYSELKQKEVISILKDREIGVGQKAIAAALAEMAKVGDIKTRRGDQNSIYYSLLHPQYEFSPEHDFEEGVG